MAQKRKFNLFAGLGLLSVVLTGGIGLLQIDPSWVAVKEAAIPAVLGLIVAGSALTRYPLVRVILFSPALIDVERIQHALDARGQRAAFEQRLKTATWMLAGSFAFSAVMNYLLATWIVVSPAGSAAFNAELGRLALLSYPVIALPSMLIMAAVFWYLARSIKTLAGLALTDALKH